MTENIAGLIAVGVAVFVLLWVWLGAQADMK
jgi:hypothetical protein